jgi:hypothetical protein
MEEIFKKSTFCFTDESEYEKFKESCLQRSKDFCGWDIRNEYDLIGFNEEFQKEHGFKFKVTFDMLRVV